MDNTTEISLYDINKTLISQMSPMADEEIIQKKTEIRNFINKTKNRFYMLLCRDNNYYTLFEKQTFVTIKDVIEDVVIECSINYGELYSINESEDGNAYEIWVRNQETKECFMFMFFPYDLGVITCR